MPKEILLTLPNHLHAIEDYQNLAGTCRTVRRCLASTLPCTILRLAAKSSETLFQPSPYFLVAATARQLGTWAAQSESNEATLQNALKYSIKSLFELCLKQTGLTMERIRQLHRLRFTTIDLVANLINKYVFPQGLASSSSSDGGVTDAQTIRTAAIHNFFHLAIYGELFAESLTAFLEPDSGRRMLAVHTRLECIKWCIPGWSSYMWHYAVYYLMREDGSTEFLRANRPADPDSMLVPRKGTNAILCDNHRRLWRLLSSTRWDEEWASTQERFGLDFVQGREGQKADGKRVEQEQWKQAIWEGIFIQ